MTTIIQAVQEFGRHEDAGVAHKVLAFTIRTIVLGFETIAVGPRIQNRAFLRIVFVEIRFQFVVETAFVTIRPPDDRRMVYVAGNHFFNQFATNFGVVFAVPAGQFIHYIQTQRVAIIEENGIWRIVRHTHGIHVHFLDNLHIGQVVGVAQGAARFRTETVAVYTFHQDAFSVDVQTIVFAHFDGTEAKTLTHFVLHFTFVKQTEFYIVKIGRFCGPVLHTGHLGFDDYFVAAVAHGR